MKLFSSVYVQLFRPVWLFCFSSVGVIGNLVTFLIDLHKYITDCQLPAKYQGFQFLFSSVTLRETYIYLLFIAHQVTIIWLGVIPEGVIVDEKAFI